MHVDVVPSPASLFVSSDADLITDRAMKSDSVSGSAMERKTEMPSFVILAVRPVMRNMLCPYGPAVYPTIFAIFCDAFLMPINTSSVLSLMRVKNCSVSIDVRLSSYRDYTILLIGKLYIIHAETKYLASFLSYVMVNSLIMNIDIREYLRINPISVHKLTLSGDGKDCFLYFPG